MKPLRKVVGGDEAPREGRNHVFAHTDRVARWWELELECGHTVERDVEYSKEKTPSRFYVPYNGRSGEDVLPAQKRARCEQCPDA